jgi:uncharacterized BrkB/YihY/UPF0761 family membrane protein
VIRVANQLGAVRTWERNAMENIPAERPAKPRLVRDAAWAILVFVVLAGLAVVLVPVWIIRPFESQSRQGLEFSYVLRSWSQTVTLITSAVAFALAFWLWFRSRRWWSKLFLVAILATGFLSTWFARQNHFEWMFNSLNNPSYAKPSDAAFPGEGDMVLAVENNGEAVAYPVRLLAYHHVVQDIVGGTPIVATY